MFEVVEKMIGACRKVPVAVFIILSTIFNYMLGDNIARTNELYSNIGSYGKLEFFKALIQLVVIWLVVRTFNQVVGKIEKHWLLDSNYMKWIKKLTYSKLSSISTVSTGAANNAINTIAMCNKGMVDCVMSIIPNIIPFIMLCKKEWDTAGWGPTVVNIGCIAAYVLYSLKAAKFESYKRAAKARAAISTVTVDCIKNSQTVKYFNKENWSIKRQDDKQAEVFGASLAIPANILNTLFYAVMWLPTFTAVWLCWEDTATTLYVIMMSYVIDNIGGYIGCFFDSYTEKKNQLEILGRLEKDDNRKNSIVDKIDISNVEFSYDPENENAVKFKINSLIIQKGHRYCVTGKSGFGKSTLAKLITGTYVPTEGNIPLVESVYMFAESEMFNMSIADNITLGEAYDEKEILDMLDAFEVSTSLDIFKDSVGENGNKLSTGQKQRINLCRTLFYARRHPSSLIVMDEVTAALDIKTSLTCLRYITDEFKRLGITLVYISNKTDYLETSLVTDDIYVHRDGNVVTYCQKREIPEIVPILKK
jgi:ABC-type bacteriocin/lantibiotic exporter with double-glycine peptidase domain